MKKLIVFLILLLPFITSAQNTNVQFNTLVANDVIVSGGLRHGADTVRLPKNLGELRYKDFDVYICISLTGPKRWRLLYRVKTFMGREGDVVALASDYESFYPRLDVPINNPTFVANLPFSKINNRPTSMSGYGIIPNVSDYNGIYVRLDQSYSNPSFIQTLDISKITGGSYISITGTPTAGQFVYYNGTSWTAGKPTIAVGGESGGIPLYEIVNSDSLNFFPLQSTAEIIATNVSKRIQLSIGAVSGSKLIDGSVTSAKIASGVIPTALPPNGSAGGDLGGNFPNPTVVAIQGRPFSNTAPTVGQIPKWNGSAWAPSADNSGTGGTGVQSITNGDLTPLFTGGVNNADPDNPVLTFAPTSQAARNFYASPYAGAGTPLFRSIQIDDIPTVTYQKGGFGLTTLGTAGQSLRVNSGATGFEYYTPSSGGLPDFDGANKALVTNGTNDGAQWVVSVPVTFQKRDSAFLNFPSINGGSFAALTFTSNGVHQDDYPILRVGGNTDGIYYTARVVSNNTVQVIATNVTGAPIDPPSLEFSTLVLRFW